jgi:hypothetical protein
MTAALDRITRPAAGANPMVETGHSKLGLGVGVAGLLIAMVVAGLAIAAVVQVGDAGSEDTVGELLAVAFGLNTVALATIKTGIAIILIGILVRLFTRVEGIKTALPALKAPTQDQGHVQTSGTMDTPYGTCDVSETVPSELPIHKMARTLWAPMLVMGLMLVAVGFVVALVWAGNVGSDPRTALGASAWAQGLQFLGEAMVLAGISFLLGSILGGLRAGGGGVQHGLGLPVQTLKMPTTAKVFIGLMMAGMVLAIVQFVGYIVTTGFDSSVDVFTWFAFLGPLRELSLGLLLAGIVMSLATIGNVLGFQFWRIRGIITTGS